MGTHPHYFETIGKPWVWVCSSQRHACLSVDQHFYTTEDEWSNTSIYIIVANVVILIRRAHLGAFINRTLGDMELTYQV